MDNFSPHRHPDVRDSAADNDAEQNAAVGSFIRWRNARAQDRGFATDSPIRTWTHYPAKAA